MRKVLDLPWTFAARYSTSASSHWWLNLLCLLRFSLRCLRSSASCYCMRGREGRRRGKKKERRGGGKEREANEMRERERRYTAESVPTSCQLASFLGLQWTLQRPRNEAVARGQTAWRLTHEHPTGCYDDEHTVWEAACISYAQSKHKHVLYPFNLDCSRTYTHPWPPIYTWCHWYNVNTHVNGSHS